MKYYILILFLIGFYCSAQTELKGTITSDKNEPISRVSVTVTPLKSGNILAFYISDNNGEYKIQLNSSLDSIQININTLGYGKTTKRIKNISQTTNFTLVEQSIELREVVVKRGPISMFGDTLSYAVSAFKDRNDRTIGDIIKKLPGIEMDASGQIKYQGKAINKYYINGLDLLEGKYGLANGNLNVDAVIDVQVMENHQPIRMLDTLEFSDRAALNIKLKNDITTSGVVAAGIGARPFLWDLNTTPMLFTKKRQFIASIQTNNVGNPVGNQLQTFIAGGDNFETLNSKEDLLEIQKLSQPAFSEKRWLDNNIKIGTINILEKLKNDFQLKLNVDLADDLQKQVGSTETIFFLNPESEVLLIENKLNSLAFKRLKSNLIVEKNSSKKYFKNNLKFERYLDSQLGQINGTNGVLTQRLSIPSVLVSNNYKDLFRIGKQLLTLNSYINYSSAPQRLLVSPGQFTTIFNDGKDYQSMEQSVKKASFYTHNAISMTKGFKGFSTSTQAGFKFENKQLDSYISISQDRELNLDFTNNLRWEMTQYYVEERVQYRRKQWRFSLNMPLSYYDYSISDLSLSKNENIKKIVVEPRVYLKRDFAKFWEASSSINWNVDFGDFNQINYGYILSNYRNLTKRDAPLSFVKSRSLSAGLAYRNPLNAIFGSLRYTNRNSLGNLIYSSKINTNGTTELAVLENNNTTIYHVVYGNIGKYFSTLKTSINLNYTSTILERNQLINNNLFLVKNTISKPNFRISSDLAKWLGVEYKYSFSTINNNLQVQKANQQIHSIDLSLYPIEKFNFGLKTEYYHNDFNNKITNNYFSDLTGRYSIGKRKIDLVLNWTNIFNTNRILNVQSSTFTYVETVYNLRPSQVVFKVEFGF